MSSLRPLVSISCRITSIQIFFGLSTIYPKHKYRVVGNLVANASMVTVTTGQEDEKIWLSNLPSFMTKLCQEDLTPSTICNM